MDQWRCTSVGALVSGFRLQSAMIERDPDVSTNASAQELLSNTASVTEIAAVVVEQSLGSRLGADAARTADRKGWCLHDA